VNVCVDAHEAMLALEGHVPTAVRLLRWEGRLIGPLRVAGRRVSCVVSLIDPVHQYRQDAGLPPMVDHTEVAIRSEIGQLGELPPAAVHLVGVIGAVRHLGTARHSVFPLSTMCPAVIVMSRCARNSMCVPSNTEGLLARLGVVAVDDHGSVDVLREPLTPHRYPPEYEVWRRWVLEVMYERALFELGKAGDR